MRIIAGELGGRQFDSPHSERTHPMSDKMRGAMFNVLGDISDLHVLDAFAGTGALAFEAISRGALSAVTIEQDRAAQSVIQQNIASLGLADKVTLVSAPAGSWLQTSQQATPAPTFDLILCDPPYGDLQQNLLAQLAQRTQQKGGIFVLSYPAVQTLPEFSNLELIQHKTYGDAQLAFYRAVS